MIALGIIILICAATLTIVASLATLRKLPGNNIFGLRVEEARADKEVWDLAHAVAGPIWFLGGISLFISGLLTLNASGWMWLLIIVTIIVAVIAVSIGSNMGARAAYLAAKAKKNADKPAVNLNALRNAARKADSN